MRRMFGVAATALALFLVRDVGEGSLCVGRDRSVVVDPNRSTMALCANGRAERRFRVATGRGGLAKKKEGDGRTPVGRYALGAPRPSSSFGTFIPVAYPTMVQRREGLTGSAIGVHGPKRGFRWLPGLTTTVNWTDGCIAVATDEEIDEIATWVRERAARQIVVLP